MNPAIESIARQLERLDVEYSRHEDSLVLLIPSPIGAHPCLFREHGRFIIFACPRLLMVSEDRRPEVAKFLGRANFLSVFARWGLDFDGEVCLEMSLLNLEREHELEEIGTLLSATTAVIMETMPRLVRVLFAGASAEEADFEPPQPWDVPGGDELQVNTNIAAAEALLHQLFDRDADSAEEDAA